MKLRFLALALALLGSTTASAAGVSFAVTFPASMSAAPLDGRRADLSAINLSP